MQSTKMNTQVFGPIRQKLRFPFIGDLFSVPAIARLFLLSGPTHISGHVAPFYVDAVQRMRARWSRTHIGKEGLKGFTPGRVNDNTASAIVGETRYVVVFTTSDNASPCTIFFRRFVTASMAMRSMRLLAGLCCSLFLQTSTTRCMSILETFGGYKCSIPTITYANPVFVSCAYRGRV